MDCKTARLLLDYARPAPAELPGGDAAAVEGHLTACPECEAAARAERQVDDHLGRAVRDVPVPDGLRDRLLARLRAERRRWYRRWALRGAAATAAALALVLGLWQPWHRTALPSPDLERLVQHVSENNAARVSADPDRVQTWLRTEYGNDVWRTPHDFDLRALNYGLLTYADLAEFQGKTVPMLLFANGPAQVRVYVLSSDQFGLEELKQQQPRLDSHGYTVEPRADPDDGRILYLFIYTGNSMDPFLIGAPPING